VHTRTMALLSAVTAVVVAGLVAAAPSGAAPDATRLTISVSDGVSQVTDKASVAYVATIANDGAAAVSGTLVLQLPPYARYGRVSEAKVTKHVATWTVRVPARATVVRRANATLGIIPSDQLRVTSLASLYLGPVAGSPAIRAADTDRITGVDDPPVRPVRQSASRAPAASGGHGGGSREGLVVGLPLVGGAGLAGLTALWWWRRRVAPAHDA
jgi:hypothetical protein